MTCKIAFVNKSSAKLHLLINQVQNCICYKSNAKLHWLINQVPKYII